MGRGKLSWQHCNLLAHNLLPAERQRCTVISTKLLMPQLQMRLQHFSSNIGSEKNFHVVAAPCDLRVCTQIKHGVSLAVPPCNANERLPMHSDAMAFAKWYASPMIWGQAGACAPCGQGWASWRIWMLLRPWHQLPCRLGSISRSHCAALPQAPLYA